MSNQVARNGRGHYYVLNNHLAQADKLIKYSDDTGANIENSSMTVTGDDLDIVGTLTVPIIHTTNISNPDGPLIIEGATLDLKDIAVDTIVEATLDQGVLIEDKYLFRRDGADIISCSGNINAPNATQDARHNIVAKRDVDYHLVSDTDGVAANDDPNLYLWRDSQTRMGKLCICNSSGMVKLVTASDAVACGFSIETGGSYTAPVVSGCNITVPVISSPLEGFSIDDSQNCFMKNGNLQVGSSTNSSTIVNIGSATGAQLNVIAEQDGGLTSDPSIGMIKSTLGNTQAGKISINNNNVVYEASGTSAGHLFYCGGSYTNSGTLVGPSILGDNVVLELKEAFATIGNSDDSADQLLRVQSTQDANFWLQADTNNGPTETENPSIYMTQDGNLSGVLITLDGPSNDLVLNCSDSCRIYTEAAVTNNGEDVLPTIATGNLSLSIVNGGIQFVGGADTIAWGKNRTSFVHQMQASTGTYAGGTTTFYYARIGDMVTVQSSVIPDNAITTGAYFTSGSAIIPVNYRPIGAVNVVVSIINNGIYGFGLAKIAVNGFVTIYSGPDDSGTPDTFTNTGSVGTWSVSYMV